MPAWLRQPWLIRACRIGIGVIFIAAGLAKLGDLQTFAEQIHNFRLMPVAGENLLAMALPWIELLAGLALLFRLQERAGAWISAGLMLLFTLVVAQAWLRGLDIECGCFGTADASRVGLEKLLQNTGLTLAALVGVLDPRASGD